MRTRAPVRRPTAVFNCAIGGDWHACGTSRGSGGDVLSRERSMELARAKSGCCAALSGEAATSDAPSACRNCTECALEHRSGAQQPCSTALSAEIGTPAGPRGAPAGTFSPESAVWNSREQSPGAVLRFRERPRRLTPRQRVATAPNAHWSTGPAPNSRVQLRYRRRLARLRDLAGLRRGRSLPRAQYGTRESKVRVLCCAFGRGRDV